MTTGCGSGLRGRSCDDRSCVCRHDRAQAAAHKISEYQEREKARVAVSGHVRVHEGTQWNLVFFLCSGNSGDGQSQ